MMVATACFLLVGFRGGPCTAMHLRSDFLARQNSRHGKSRREGSHVTIEGLRDPEGLEGPGCDKRPRRA